LFSAFVGKATHIVEIGEKMRTQKRGQSGIGTLIIFIGFILVAAIAANILIQTSSSLQSKALTTGSKAKSQVSTALSILDISGTGGLANINHVSIVTKLAPGSDPIKLTDTIVTITLSNISQSYRYNDTLSGSCASAGSTEFNAYNMITGTNARDGYVTVGDVVEFCFGPPLNITEGAKATLKIVPKTGTPVQAEFKAPDLIVKDRTYLFP
jgi:flagellin FlaB